jgi:hypothetical protein
VETVTTPAGWYPSPEGAGLRYWDGTAWTNHYHQPGEQHPTPTAPPGLNDRRWRWTGAVTAQAGVLFVTFVLGMLGVFIAEDAWFVALAQAAAGLGFVGWLAARRRGPAMLVPVVSFALTVGLAAVSYTVAVACSDRALSAFEELAPPPGVSVELFVSPSQGCMAETTPARTEGIDVAGHYRSEFRKQGWRVDEDEGLWAERDGVYVNVYNAEGRVYFIVGLCREWGTRCLSERGR